MISKDLTPLPTASSKCAIQKQRHPQLKSYNKNINYLQFIKK